MLLLVVDRYRNAEIAARLGISKRTVESHLAALLRKFGVADRAHLVAIGRSYDPGGAPVEVRAVVARSVLTMAECRKLRWMAAMLHARAARRCASAAERIDESRQVIARSKTLVAGLAADKLRSSRADHTQ